MNITHVIAPGPLAGAEEVVLLGASAQLELGHETRVLGLTGPCGLHPSFKARAEGLGLEVVEVEATGRARLTSIIGVRELLRHDDVVHTHGYHATTLAPAVRGLAVWAASLHGFTRVTARVRAYEAMERMVVGAADHVFAVSEELAAAVGGRAEVSILDNPVDGRRFPELPLAAAADVMRLLFVGRLSEEKGIPFLLAALERYGDATLDIVGDGPMRGALEQQSRSLGLGARVRFHGRRTDVSAYLERSHALVLPSLTEGAPLVVIEALASGRPVIATEVGDVARLVPKGSGVLARPGDASGLASCIGHMHRHLPSYLSNAFEGRAGILGRFGPTTWAEQTTAHYRRAKERSWTGSCLEMIGGRTLRPRSTSSLRSPIRTG